VYFLRESTKKKVSFSLCLFDKKKVSPPRVRVPVFEPRSGNTRETGTRRHTGTKEKSDRDNYNNNNNNNNNTQ
jgi:hypothetical protein